MMWASAPAVLLRTCRDVDKGRVLGPGLNSESADAAGLSCEQSAGRGRWPGWKGNHAQPLSLWTWSKVARRIAVDAGVPQFSTHTLRHLCLTDLARMGWEIHAIAAFADARAGCDEGEGRTARLPPPPRPHRRPRPALTIRHHQRMTIRPGLHGHRRNRHTGVLYPQPPPSQATRRARRT